MLRKQLLLAILLLLLTALSQLPASVHAIAPLLNWRHVCPDTTVTRQARCHSIVWPNASSTPVGLSPDIIKAIYKFSSSQLVGMGRTIAIVDAYDNPTAESDLNVFSR